METTTTISNPTMNRPTVFEMTKNVLPIYYCYSGFGIIAIICNFIVISVYMSNNILRSKFSLYIGLAVADFINGLGFLFTGISRLQNEYSYGNLYKFPTPYQYECAVEIGNIFQVIGAQWPAFITCGLGIERFIAVKCPLTFRNYKNKMYHGLLITSLFISLVSILTALYIGLVINRMEIVNFTCSLSNAYGYKYSTFNYLITIISHVLGFILNTAALCHIRLTAKKVGIYNKVLSTEYTKVKIMLFISSLSIIMVVLPNLFLYMSRFIEDGMNYLILGWTYCLFTLRSAFNIWVIGFTVNEFKSRFYQIMCPGYFNKKQRKNEISKSPISKSKNSIHLKTVGIVTG